jgi:hypothetical protein
MIKINQNFSPRLICVEHGIFDTLPCPWPNCVNGCIDSEFEFDELIPLMNVGNNEIYTRTEWKSPAGDSY